MVDSPDFNGLPLLTKHSPPSQLKSLDKKIAKAENGTGVTTEDAASLKLVKPLTTAESPHVLQSIIYTPC